MNAFTFNTSTIVGLPDGPHSMVFASADGKSWLVVERVLSRTVDGVPVTSVMPGVTAEVHVRDPLVPADRSRREME